MNKLAILGASGHGKVVADLAEITGWQHIHFFDDAWPAKQSNAHWEVMGDTQGLCDRLADYDGVVVAIGNNQICQQKMTVLREHEARLVSLIHPAAVVSRYADIGEGSVVFAGVVVNAFCQIGSGAILNTSCTIDHDARLGDMVHVSPGAHLGGEVELGDGVWVGIGASIRQQIKVGAYAVIGAGAAVVSHIDSQVMAYGVPARRVK